MPEAGDAQPLNTSVFDGPVDGVPTLETTQSDIAPSAEQVWAVDGGSSLMNPDFPLALRVPEQRLFTHRALL